MTKLKNSLSLLMTTKARIWLGLLLLIIIATAWYTGETGLSKVVLFPARPAHYQAVFLSNGQVYFGRIAHPAGIYVTLRDVYYLQVAPSLTATTSNGQQMQLVKLDNQLHGPSDTMRINRDHILFIEDLKPQSSVMKIITESRGAKAN